MLMAHYLLLLVSCLLVNNYVMCQFLGICPFLGVSKKFDTALGMGLAVTFVMTLATFITWIVEHVLLVPLKLMYLRTIAFILVIAVLVQVVEMVLKKVSFSLYQALGVYLPLITTNCAVLGVALLNSDAGSGLLESVLTGCFSALGFTLSLLLFSCIRERLALNKMPEWMEGFAGALISAGLMSVAFMGFRGLIG